MKQKILTVIVPSYNMEALLRKDLQSLLISKNPQRLEVIVINDGSKDQTLVIAQEFQSRFPETFEVIDKPNGNYGSCINAGLKVATGKYIKIMDADDYFDTEVFEAFIDCLEKIDADVVVNDYKKIYTGGKQEEFEYSFPSMQTIEIAEVYEESLFSSLLLPAITYRTSILRKMEYHQSEGISYTDMEWCYSPMTQMTTLFYFNRPIYMYIMGREGQTMDPNIYQQRIPHIFKCLHSLMGSVENKELVPWAKRFAVEQLAKHACAMYRYHLIDNPKYQRQLLWDFDAVLKEKNPEVYEICGTAEYRKKISYRYVEEWRLGRHEFIPFSVRAKEVVYDILGTIHYCFLKFFNPELKR